MSKAGIKIGGQTTQINLYQRYRGFLETFVEQNPCTAVLKIKKVHGTHNVSITIEWSGMTANDRSRVISRIRHLKSATLVHPHDDTGFAFELNSGYPFLEGFLLELDGALDGRYGYETSFNPKLHRIDLVDEHGSLIHEVIDKLARTRVWTVSVGNEGGYDPNMRLSFTANAGMDRESAMHELRLVSLAGDCDLGYGTRVAFEDPEEHKRIADHVLLGYSGDDTLVLVEITDTIGQQRETTNKWIVVFENQDGPDLKSILDQAEAPDIEAAMLIMNLMTLVETDSKHRRVAFCSPDKQIAMENAYPRFLRQWPVLIKDPR